jgi:nickel-dependent lactate racemase
MILFSGGSTDTEFSPEEVRGVLFAALDKLGKMKRILAVPPDFTRVHSQAGFLTRLIWEYYGKDPIDILPAIGTHHPMTDEEIGIMFGKIPKTLFRIHDWKRGISALGEVPAAFVREVSEGKLDFSIPIQVDRLIASGSHDLILSIGQVVPHEVIGMAGYNKNIFVGTGGADAIHKTHFLGAVYGMERVMGRTETPVRKVLNYGSDHFSGQLPLLHVMTVVGRNNRGDPVIRGLFIGDTVECFCQAAALSHRVNLTVLDAPIRKAVVYLNPSEFQSAWLGNKSIYRTRMALADNAELIILAPGLRKFGEDDRIDRLIRKYGYVGTPRVLELVRTQNDLGQSLATAAHLIHGSSEGRFKVTYCPGHLTRQEIEGVHFSYADLEAMTARYNPAGLSDGFNVMADGEEVFFISSPSLGLWACRDRL